MKAYKKKEDVNNSVRDLQNAFADNIVHIYCAAKACRDEGTELLNKGVSKTKEREYMKISWRALNEFCKAYEECFPLKEKP